MKLNVLNLKTTHQKQPSQPSLERTPLAETPKKPSYRRILSNPSLTFLWLGQLISQSGDFIFEVALFWYVLVSTHSPFLVGVTVGITLLPPAVMAPIAGVYADRVNRRNLMITSNLFQGLITVILAALYSTNNLTFPLLLVLIFLLISGNQFFRPALQATIPRLATQTDLLTANSLFSISTSANQLVGYGLGGIIVALAGFTLPIYYDGITFFLAATIFLLIPKTLGQITTTAEETEEPNSFTARFREGLYFIQMRPILVELVVVALVVNFSSAAASAIIAPYAQSVLHGDAGTFGFLTATFSLGLILGSLVVGKIDARRHVGEFTFLGIAVFGLAFLLLGTISEVTLALIITFMAGVANALVNLPLSALLQVIVPSKLMGRVYTSLVALATFAQPIAATAAGGIVDYTSIAGGMRLFGLVILATSFVTALRFKELRMARY